MWEPLKGGESHSANFFFLTWYLPVKPIDHIHTLAIFPWRHVQDGKLKCRNAVLQVSRQKWPTYEYVVFFVVVFFYNLPFLFPLHAINDTQIIYSNMQA